MKYIYLIIFILLSVFKCTESISQAGYFQFKRYEQTVFQASLIHPLDKYILLAATPGVLVKLYLTNSTSTFNAHRDAGLEDWQEHVSQEQLEEIYRDSADGLGFVDRTDVNHKYIGSLIKFPFNPHSVITSMNFDVNYLNVFLVTTYNEIVKVNLNTMEVTLSNTNFTETPTLLHTGIGRSFACGNSLYVFRDSPNATYAAEYNAFTLKFLNSLVSNSPTFQEKSSLLDCVNQRAYVIASYSGFGRSTVMMQVDLANISVVVNQVTYSLLNEYCSFFYQGDTATFYTLTYIPGTRNYVNVTMVNSTSLEIITSNPLNSIFEIEVGVVYCSADQELGYTTVFGQYAFQFTPPTPATAIAPQGYVDTQVLWQTSSGGQIVSVVPTSNPHLPPNMTVLLSCNFDSENIFISQTPECNIVFLQPNSTGGGSSGGSDSNAPDGLLLASSSGAEPQNLTNSYNIIYTVYFSFNSPSYNFISMVYEDQDYRNYVSFQNTYKGQTYLDILRIYDPINSTDQNAQIVSVVSVVLGITQPLEAYQISATTIYFFFTSLFGTSAEVLQQLSVIIIDFSQVSMSIYDTPIVSSIESYLNITMVPGTAVPEFLVTFQNSDTLQNELTLIEVGLNGMFIQNSTTTSNTISSMNKYLVNTTTAFYFSSPNIYIYNPQDVKAKPATLHTGVAQSNFIGSFYDLENENFYVLLNTLPSSDSSQASEDSGMLEQAQWHASDPDAPVFQVLEINLDNLTISALSETFSINFPLSPKGSSYLSLAGAFKDENLGYFFLENGYVITINTTTVEYYQNSFIQVEYSLLDVEYNSVMNTAYAVESSGYLIEYLDCMAGAFRNKTLGRCEMCPIGTYSPMIGASECTPCPAGMISNHTGSFECLPCPAGTFSTVYADVCIQCTGNTYNPEPKSILCQECPVNSVPMPGNTQCICADGYYGYSPSNCTACPTGGNCTSGAIFLLPNYWSSPEFNSSIYSCPMPGACLAGAVGSCAEGYYGNECDGCIDGWSMYINSCSECPSKLYVTYIVIFIFFAILITLLLIAYRAGFDVSFSALKILISYGQVISSISQSITTNQVLLERLLTLLTFSNLDFFHILSLDCLMGRQVGFYEKYWVMVFTPLIIIIAIVSLHYTFQLIRKVRQILAQRRRDKRKIEQRKSVSSIAGSATNTVKQPLISDENASELLYTSQEFTYFDLKNSGSIHIPPRKKNPMKEMQKKQFKLEHPNPDALFRDILLILLLAYPAVCQSILSIYSCTEINGIYYIENDLNTLCQGPQWKAHAVINLIFVVIYPIGIPALFLVLLFLWKQKKWISDEKCKERLSLLFTSYKDKYWYWEVVELFRKLLLTSAVSISFKGSGIGVFNKDSINMLVSAFAVFFQIQFKPFSNNSDNWLQLNSLGMIYFMYFFLVISNEEPSSSISIQNLGTSDSVVLLLFGTVVVVHGAILGVQYIRKLYPQIVSTVKLIYSKLKYFFKKPSKLFKKTAKQDLPSDDDDSYSFSDTDYEYYQSIQTNEQ